MGVSRSVLYQAANRQLWTAVDRRFDLKGWILQQLLQRIEPGWQMTFHEIMLSIQACGTFLTRNWRARGGRLKELFYQ